MFADSALVNEALRLLIKVARQHHARPVEPGMAYGGWLATVEPDVAAVFDRSINEALRNLIQVARNAVPVVPAGQRPQT